MRTIKFKAKNRICEWVKGDLLQYLDGTVYIGDNKGPWTDDGFHNSDYTRVEIVDHNTVCQFTGLLDRNGKEIYEGDVLRSDTYPYSCTEIKERDNYYGAIYWSRKDAAFNIMCIKNIKSSSDRIMFDGYSYSISKDSSQDFEVIGNIHDPEWKQYIKFFQEAYNEQHQ